MSAPVLKVNTVVDRAFERLSDAKAMADRAMREYAHLDGARKTLLDRVSLVPMNLPGWGPVLTKDAAMPVAAAKQDQIYYDKTSNQFMVSRSDGEALPVANGQWLDSQISTILASVATISPGLVAAHMERVGAEFPTGPTGFCCAAPGCGRPATCIGAFRQNGLCNVHCTHGCRTYSRDGENHRFVGERVSVEPGVAGATTIVAGVSTFSDKGPVTLAIGSASSADRPTQTPIQEEDPLRQLARKSLDKDYQAKCLNARCETLTMDQSTYCQDCERDPLNYVVLAGSLVAMGFAIRGMTLVLSVPQGLQAFYVIGMFLILVKAGRVFTKEIRNVDI